MDPLFVENNGGPLESGLVQYELCLKESKGVYQRNRTIIRRVAKRVFSFFFFSLMTY